jgi:hypothetical protein
MCSFFLFVLQLLSRPAHNENLDAKQWIPSAVTCLIRAAASPSAETSTKTAREGSPVLTVYLLGYTVQPAEIKPTFRRNISPPSAGSLVSQGGSACYSLHTVLLLGSLSYTEDGGVMLLRNVGLLSADYKAVYCRTQTPPPPARITSCLQCYFPVDNLRPRSRAD